MPYGNPNDPRKAESAKKSRERRKEKRKDPEHARNERERDRETRKKREESEPGQLARRLDNQRGYEKSRRGLRNEYQRVAYHRRVADDAYRIKLNFQVRLHMHGITEEEYRAIKLLQGMKCAVCRRGLPPFDQTPKPNQEHIDHDHVTDRIRGILCGGCNTAIGKLGDNVEGLERALAYVKDELIF